MSIIREVHTGWMFRGWSDRERAEILRTRWLVQSVYGPLDVEFGETDEGDPWAALAEPEEGCVVAHFARTRTEVIVDFPGEGLLSQGNTLRETLARLVAAAQGPGPWSAPRQVLARAFEPSNRTGLGLSLALGLLAWDLTTEFLQRLGTHPPAPAATDLANSGTQIGAGSAFGALETDTLLDAVTHMAAQVAAAQLDGNAGRASVGDAELGAALASAEAGDDALDGGDGADRPEANAVEPGAPAMDGPFAPAMPPARMDDAALERPRDAQDPAAETGPPVFEAEDTFFFSPPGRIAAARPVERDPTHDLSEASGPGRASADHEASHPDTALGLAQGRDDPEAHEPQVPGSQVHEQQAPDHGSALNDSASRDLDDLIFRGEADLDDGTTVHIFASPDSGEVIAVSETAAKAALGASGSKSDLGLGTLADGIRSALDADPQARFVEVPGVGDRFDFSVDRAVHDPIDSDPASFSTTVGDSGSRSPQEAEGWQAAEGWPAGAEALAQVPELGALFGDPDSGI